MAAMINYILYSAANYSFFKGPSRTLARSLLRNKDKTLIKGPSALSPPMSFKSLDAHSHNLHLSSTLSIMFPTLGKMLVKSSTLFLTLLSVIGSTAQADGGDGGGGQNVNPLAITSSQIEKIAPKSVSCDNAEAEDECATSDTAARAISASFNRYKVSSRAEQAAVIGLMAFESNEFQYNRNHFPGVEGQGSTFRFLLSSLSFFNY